MTGTVRIAASLLLVLFVFMQPAAGQTTELTKFRALLTNGMRIEGHDGSLSPDSLRGTMKNGRDTAIAVLSIRALDRSTGSQAGKGALIGGGLGLTSALLGWMQASADAASDPYTEVDDSKVAPLILGFTAGGAVIGLAIGSSMEKWEKVPVAASFGYLPGSRRIGFQLSLVF